MMRICKIYIHDFQQFKDFTLDLTDPNGEPLEKVCLIGRNGTGKTLLLEFLKDYFFAGILNFPNPTLKHFGFAWVEFNLDGLSLFFTKTKNGYPCVLTTLNQSLVEIQKTLLVIKDLEGATEKDIVHINEVLENPSEFFNSYGDYGMLAIKPYFSIKKVYNKISLLGNINANFMTDADIYTNLQTTLDSSLKNSDDFKIIYNISEQTDKDNFWSIFTKHLSQRRDKWDAVIDAAENQTEQVGVLKTKFDLETPNFIPILAELWDKILDKAGLELDTQNIKVPRIPNKSLEANIRLKKTKEPISYYHLSTGIRNFLFKIGHLRALYFERKIENGFVFYDEPETSLHADFLYDFVSEYLNFMTNTQLFMATHSEIIASQFEPYERVILEYDPDDLTRVRARKGIAPIGDDPNDVLKQDFNTKVHNRHPKAQEAWKRYLELSELIANNGADKAQRKAWVQEYLQIGQAYNFPEPQNLSE